MTTTATADLTRALINTAAAGLRPHCSDPGTSDLWLSDHPGERREAAKLCRHCPVIVECRQAADARGERWHVASYTRMRFSELPNLRFQRVSSRLPDLARPRLNR
jgi:hypothetical protein